MEGTLWTRWEDSFIAPALSTNIFRTCSLIFSHSPRPYRSRSHLSAIAMKVWEINGFSSQFAAHSLTPVVLVVIESATIYSCTPVAFRVCCLINSWAGTPSWTRRGASNPCGNDVLTLRGFSDITHYSKGYSDHTSLHFWLTSMRSGLCFQHGDCPLGIGAL